MYITARTGTETLNINYRNGAAWSSLGTITGTGWKNITATGLTSATYTIQLIGATETGDTEQGSWSIDCLFLHTWNDSNCLINFEYQWTAEIYTAGYICYFRVIYGSEYVFSSTAQGFIGQV